jgi:DNA-binding winged helix-turn-helix (wHTH) protein
VRIHFRASPADRADHEFTLDSETRQLLCGGHEIRLSPKAFDVLCALVERRPKVVTKAELHSRIWPGTFVVDTNLNVLIGEIRRAVSDTPQQPRFIRTVHKIGYAFCAAATELEPGTPALSTRGTRCWLVWNDQTFLLSEGDNIIGRDPDCSIWVDAGGVSRRHARIQISNASPDAWLDDLASTNGTFLRNSRVAGREGLKDGDVIGIGSVELTFRVWSADTPKKTDRIPRRRL